MALREATKSSRKERLQPVFHVGYATIRLDVFRAAQPLLNTAKHFGRGFAFRFPEGHAYPYHAHQNDHHGDSEEGVGQANAPILPVEDAQDADEEQYVAKEPQHKLGKKVGELLPRRSSMRSIIAPGVKSLWNFMSSFMQWAREVVAQPVGGPPLDILGDVGRAQPDHLLSQRHGQKEDSHLHQQVYVAACLCGVDKATHNLRARPVAGQCRPESARLAKLTLPRCGAK